MRRVGLLVAAGMLLGLGGCSTSTIHSGVSLNGGESALIQVDGSSPSVELANKGPGTVWVDVKVPAHNDAEGSRLVAGSALSRSTSAGPIEMKVTNEGSDGATLDVEAKGVSGFSVSKPAGGVPNPTLKVVK
jgi:hypothetical protein